MSKRSLISIACALLTSFAINGCSKKYTTDDFCNEADYSKAVIAHFSNYVATNRSSIDSDELVKRFNLVKQSMKDLDKTAPDAISSTAHNLHVTVDEIDDLFQKNDYDLAAIFKDPEKSADLSRLFKNFNSDTPKLSAYAKKTCK